MMAGDPLSLNPHSSSFAQSRAQRSRRNVTSRPERNQQISSSFLLSIDRKMIRRIAKTTTVAHVNFFSFFCFDFSFYCPPTQSWRLKAQLPTLIAAPVKWILAKDGHGSRRAASLGMAFRYESSSLGPTIQFSAKVVVVPVPGRRRGRRTSDGCSSGTRFNRCSRRSGKL